MSVQEETIFLFFIYRLVNQLCFVVSKVFLWNCCGGSVAIYTLHVDCIFMIVPGNGGATTKALTPEIYFKAGGQHADILRLAEPVV